MSESAKILGTEPGRVGDDRPGSFTMPRRTLDQLAALSVCVLHPMADETRAIVRKVRETDERAAMVALTDGADPLWPAARVYIRAALMINDDRRRRLAILEQRLCRMLGIKP